MLRTVLSILMPFVGTSLGACSAFFIKNKINQKINRIILGFSGGIMLAASIWSLILPSIEQSEPLKKMSFFPAALGICIGIAYLILTDKLTADFCGYASQYTRGYGGWRGFLGACFGKP